MEQQLQNSTKKLIHLRPRLDAAAKLIGECRVLADIGCDHGKLGIALLQRNRVSHAILSEISESSLEKARNLAKITGLEKRTDFRVGSGLSTLKEAEADTIAICGMGGMMIKEILEEARPSINASKKAVLQPMRSIDELREYLFMNNYSIVSDVIAADHGRLYQIFSVISGKDELPFGWPEGFFAVGFKTVYDPLFKDLATNLLKECENALKAAFGSSGEAELMRRANGLKQVLELYG